MASNHDLPEEYQIKNTRRAMDWRECRSVQALGYRQPIILPAFEAPDDEHQDFDREDSPINSGSSWGIHAKHREANSDWLNNGFANGWVFWRDLSFYTANQSYTIRHPFASWRYWTQAPAVNNVPNGGDWQHPSINWTAPQKSFRILNTCRWVVNPAEGEIIYLGNSSTDSRGDIALQAQGGGRKWIVSQSRTGYWDNVYHRQVDPWSNIFYRLHGLDRGAESAEFWDRVAVPKPIDFQSGREHEIRVRTILDVDLRGIPKYDPYGRPESQGFIGKYDRIHDLARGNNTYSQYEAGHGDWFARNEQLCIRYAFNLWYLNGKPIGWMIGQAVNQIGRGGDRNPSYPDIYKDYIGGFAPYYSAPPDLPSRLNGNYANGWTPPKTSNTDTKLYASAKYIHDYPINGPTEELHPAAYTVPDFDPDAAPAMGTSKNLYQRRIEVAGTGVGTMSFNPQTYDRRSVWNGSKYVSEPYRHRWSDSVFSIRYDDYRIVRGGFPQYAYYMRAELYLYEWGGSQYSSVVFSFNYRNESFVDPEADLYHNFQGTNFVYGVVVWDDETQTFDASRTGKLILGQISTYRLTDQAANEYFGTAREFDVTTYF